MGQEYILGNSGKVGRIAHEGLRDTAFHCLLPGVYRLPQLTMLGGFGSIDRCVLNRLVIGGRQHVGGGFPAVAGPDGPANGA